MDNKKLVDDSIALIGWALLFIWWGLRWSIFANFPQGSGLLITSLILFGVNLARTISGIHTYAFTTFFAVYSLLAGAMLFTFAMLGTAYQPPIFVTLLISLGVVLLGYGVINFRLSKLSSS